MSDNAKSGDTYFEDVDYHALLDESLLKSQRPPKKPPFYYKNITNNLSFNFLSASINENFIDDSINIVINDEESCLANFSRQIAVNRNGKSMENDNRKCLLNETVLRNFNGNSERIKTDDYINVVSDNKRHLINRGSENFHKRQMSNTKHVDETSTIESVTSYRYSNNDYKWDTKTMKLSLFDETYTSSKPHNYITTKSNTMSVIHSNSSDSEWDLDNVLDADDPWNEISETSSLYVNFCSDFEDDSNDDKVKLIKQQPEPKTKPNEPVKSVQIFSNIQNKEQHRSNERLQNAKETKPRVHQLRESPMRKTNKMYFKTKNKPWENVDKYNKYSTKRPQHSHRESSYTRHSSTRYRQNKYHREPDYIRTHSSHKKYYKDSHYKDHATHERKHYKTVEYNHRHSHRDYKPIDYKTRKSQTYPTSRGSPAYRPTFSYKMTKPYEYRDDRRKPHYTGHSKHAYKRHYYENRRSNSYDRSKHNFNSRKYYNGYNTSKTSRSTSHKKSTTPWY